MRRAYHFPTRRQVRVALNPLQHLLGSMSQLGQTEKNSVRAIVFRFAPESGPCSRQTALRICANARSRCAPARCAGARAERLVTRREDSDRAVEKLVT